MLKRVITIGLALCLALALGACSISFGGVDIGLTGTRGSGEIVEQITPIDEHEAGFSLAISGISLMGNFRLNPRIVIDESLEHEIVITTDDNIAEMIEVSQRGGRIVISGNLGMRVTPTELIITTGVPVVDLNVGGAWDVTLDCSRVANFRADLSGAANGDFTFGALESLDVTLSGASDANFILGDLHSVDARLSGASDLRIRGTAAEAEFRASGASSVHAFELIAEHVIAVASGASDIRVTATESLDVNASGASDVIFDGNPRVSQSTSGASNVRSR